MCGISDENYEYYESHECDCESHETLMGLDLTRLINCDFLLRPIVDGILIYVYVLMRLSEYHCRFSHRLRHYCNT